MSTKELRFIMPLYPLFCIYLSIFINKEYHVFSHRNKKIYFVLSIIISFISNNEFFSGITIINNMLASQTIIRDTKQKYKSYNNTSRIAGYKEINTFNLEAEASRQGEYAAVRQVVSNKKSYKEDLKYFDWFNKTGDQGIMTSESKDLLNSYLLNNSSFVIDKKWSLPDESELTLRRKQ